MAEWTQTTRDEFHARLMARIVARGPITDINEAGTINGLAGAVADDFGAAAAAQGAALNRNFLDVSGPQLDEAASKIRAGGFPRLGPSSATGLCITVTRSDTSAAVTVAAGATVGRSDNSAITYTTVAAVTYGIGVATGNFTLVANVRGTQGNAPAGTIDMILDGWPDTFDVVEQFASLGGGVNREDDDAYRTRARLFLASVQGGGQPAALKYLALTFRSSTGVRARHADVYSSPDNPGYCELVVDDGTAFAGYTRTGLPASGTFLNSGRVAYTESPCVDDNFGTGQITINGSPAEFDSAGDAQWTLASEAGACWFNADYVSSGTTWAISGYDVFTGFIAELQSVILGTSTNALTGFGWADAGVRVRVMPPVQDLIRISLNIALQDGADSDAVIVQCEDVLREYCASLGPGQQFQLMNASAALATISGLRNATFNALFDNTYTAVNQDWPPSSDRACIRLGDFEAT